MLGHRDGGQFLFSYQTVIYDICFVVIVVWSAVIQLSSDLRVWEGGGGEEAG